LVNQDFGDTNITSVSASTGYIASLVNGSTSVYLSYNSVTHNTSLAILKNTTLDNLTVYPMIRYESDTDATWQPYAPTNKALKQELDNDINAIWAIQGKFSSKNLLKTPYANPTPYYSAGITYSESEDGGIIINGTSSAYSILQIIRAANALPHGEYILSTQEILPSGVSVQLGYVTQGETVTFVQVGYNIVSRTSMKVAIDDRFDGNLICVRVSVNSGITLNNLEIHPMLRYAEDTDSTWQPYTPTNYQLNQKVDTIAGVYLPNATNTSSKKVVASVGQTSVTFDATAFMSRYNVTSDDLDLDISAKTASGDIVSYNNVSVTGGIVTVTFDALAEQTTFICKCSVIQ
jgi:hypothetical protein